MGGYVNIKTFDHDTADGKVSGKEVSVAFELYSDVHRIANARYQIFPSDKPAYSKVFEKNQRDEWIAENKTFFTSDPVEEGKSGT